VYRVWRRLLGVSIAWQDPSAVSFMLDECTTWAVVGLSGHTDRTVYRIAKLLQERGKRIVPIHPASPVVLGEQGFPTLEHVPFPIDVVDVFRRSSEAGRHVDEAIAVGAGAVWLQLQVIDEAAAARADAAGLDVVMDRCPRIEHPRLYGR